MSDPISKQRGGDFHSRSHLQSNDDAWLGWYPENSSRVRPTRATLVLRHPQILPAQTGLPSSGWDVGTISQPWPEPLALPWNHYPPTFLHHAISNPSDIAWPPTGQLVDSAYSSPSSFMESLYSSAPSSMDSVSIKQSMVQRYLESLPEEIDDSLIETPQMGPAQISFQPTDMMLDLLPRDFPSTFADSPKSLTFADSPKSLTEAALSMLAASDPTLSCASFSSISRTSATAPSRPLSRSSFRIPRRRSSKVRNYIQDEAENSDCLTSASFNPLSTVGCNRAFFVRQPASSVKESRARLRSVRSNSKKACNKRGLKADPELKPEPKSEPKREPEPIFLHASPIKGYTDLSGTEMCSSEEDSYFSGTELSAFEYRDDTPGTKECITRLLKEYQNWQRQHGTKRTYGQSNAPAEAGLDPISNSSPSDHAPLHSQTQGHDEATNGESNDGADIQVSKKRKSAASPSRTFACPFWKKDARKHRACGKLTLTRVKDVKQHLNRSRAHKPHYCPCCYETFPTKEALDEHSRARSCPIRDSRLVEGLTEQQSGALQRRVDRRLSDEEQWYCMWDIIFPGIPRPLSPYIDHDLSEDLAEFREFTTSDAAVNIFQDYLASRGYQFTAPSAGREMTNNIISSGFDMVYNRWLEGIRDGNGISIHQTSPLPANNPLISPPDSNSDQTSPETTRRMGSDQELGPETQLETSAPIIPGLLEGMSMSPLPQAEFEFDDYLHTLENYT